MNAAWGLTWDDPGWLALLLLLPVLAWKQVRKPVAPAMTWPHTIRVTTWRTRLVRLLPWLHMVPLALVVVALARPQRLLKEDILTTEGIDIGLVLDVSESMLAEDFKPNRLEASKRVAIDFVRRRINDRISLTLFAGEAFSPCPLTTDHRIVEESIAGIQHGILKDNTAIGDGLATAINRLKASASQSKVIILLTDGENNSGYIQPSIATDIAKTLGIKVYTIGVGIGPPLNGFPGMEETPVDEAILGEMAQRTGGKYFRAEDPKALERIYTEIDRLEKTKIEAAISRQTRDVFYPLVWLALLCLAGEMLLRFTILRSIP